MKSMLVDLHSHTTFSDGHSSHTEMYQAAQDKGIAIYGITDHLCFHDNFWTTPKHRFPEMRDTFREMKLHANGTKLLFGMEVDYVLGCEQEVARLKQENQWDYIIGSVHYIGDWNIDSNVDDWVGKDVNATYAQYYDLLEKMVESRLYDIVGHFDLPKKYGFHATEDFTPKVAAIGRKIKEANMAYEINTAGRIKVCNELYPTPSIVRLLFELGVDVTLGSDAHHRDNVGQFFDEALNLLHEVGYRRICYFEKGEKQYLDI